MNAPIHHHQNDMIRSNRPRGERGGWGNFSPRSIWDSESYESDPSCGNHYILVYEHAAPIALVQSARVTPNTRGGHPDMGSGAMGSRISGACGGAQDKT